MYAKREALIKRRKELGLDQRRIAKQLEISQGAYFKIENGISAPSIKIYNDLSRILGVNAFVFMSSTKYDLNIYDKNEPLTLIWIFVSRGWDCIDMLRVEDSHEEWKDLTLDEFSNVLYYRYINKYSLNTTYQAHGSGELRLEYIKDKSQSLLNWCLENGEYGKYIMENVQLPYGITLADFSKASNKKININCPKHGIYEQSIRHITYHMCRCPKCAASSTSYPEQFIYWALKQLYQKCKSRHKIEGLEVDVFIPEKNTCIEYNGEHWHEDKEYMDSYKRESIEHIGFDFITINEHREKIDTTINGNEINTYYDIQNKNEWLKGLVTLILEEVLHDDRSSLVDFEAVEKNAWEYSKGKIEYEKSVAYLFPKLTEEWDSSNFIKPEDITPGNHQRIQWVCKNCGNQWQAMILNRTQYKTGCPCCGWNSFTGKINPLSIKRPNSDNNVVKLYPELAKEFLPELNEGKQLENYTARSHVNIKWKCQNCGNEWTAQINGRTHKKTGCSSCGYNTFTDKINPHSINQKKEPIAVVNGVEIYM